MDTKRVGLGLILLLASYPVFAAESDDPGDKPFKPHWGNEIGFSHTNQQAGQNTNNLNYTGTYHLDESGSFVSGEVSVSTQRVAGAVAKTGTLTFSGGTAFGIFSPSLSVGFEGGESALKQLNAGLNLGFQVADPFSISLGVGASAGNHQEDLANYFPLLQTLGISAMGQFDTASLSAYLGLSYVLNDWWTVSLTPGLGYDVTYRVHVIDYPKYQKDVNLTDRTATLALGMDFTIAKGWVLGVSGQGGQEYAPAGTFYSDLAGGTVTLTTDTTTTYAAGTVSISYSFN